MTRKTRAELYAKFENGDTPTAQDFIDLLDSFVAIGDGENSLGATSNATLNEISASSLKRKDTGDTVLTLAGSPPSFSGLASDATLAQLASGLKPEKLTAAMTAPGFQAAEFNPEDLNVFDPTLQDGVANKKPFDNNSSTRSQLAVIVFDIETMSFIDTLIIKVYGPQGVFLSQGRFRNDTAGAGGTLTLFGVSEPNDSFYYVVTTESGSGPALSSASIKPYVMYFNA